MYLYLRKILCFTKCYIYSIIFILYILVLSYVLFDIHLLGFLFSISLVFIQHLLSKSYKAIYIPVTIVLTLILTFDSVFAFVLGYQQTLGIFYSVLETSSNEAKEVFGFILIPVIFIFGLISFVMFSSQHELKKSGLKVKYSIVGVCIIWLFISVSIWDKFSKRPAYQYKNTEYYSLDLQYLTSRRLPVIVNDILIYITYQSEIRKFNSYKDQKRELPLGIQDDLESPKATKVIIIVGESNAQQYFSLYGYQDAQSTPFLDSLSVVQDSPLSYYDGLASATLTRDAVPFALSFSCPQSQDKFLSQKNALELANDKGYYTSWISNQERIGIYDTAIGLISTSSNYSFFCEKGVLDDLDLIKQFEKRYTSDNSNEMYILHLISSHLPYDVRSDEKDKQAIQLPEDKTGFLNDYVRSIHHTDRVIKEVYNILLSTSDDFVILFFSDHGEVLGKNHGFVGEGADQQFPIPILAIDRSKLDVHNIVNSYVDPQTKKLNNSNMIYIISELLGYKVSPSIKKSAQQSNDYLYMANCTVDTYSNLLKAKKK